MVNKVFRFSKKFYKVIKVTESSATIVGGDNVHRKSEYRFSVVGPQSCTVAYRVGGEGKKIELHPGPDGVYVIPKGEITDDVTIGCR